MSDTLKAILLLSGMIIGVGIFAIPYSFVTAGFAIGITELIILTGLMLLLHRLYAAVVVATPSLHQMPGYVGLYLGEYAAKISWCSSLLGMIGTLFVYVLVGGSFLQHLARPLHISDSLLLWVVLFTFAGAFVTFWSPRKEALLNGVLTIILIGSLILFSVFLIPKISAQHFKETHFEFLFFPYGILLFALSGLQVIPEVVSLLRRKEHAIRTAVTAGTLIPALLYGFFAFATIGAAGRLVTVDIVGTIGALFGDVFVVFGSIIGLLAVFTSFVALSIAAQSLLRRDLGLTELVSWVIVSTLPILFYTIGIRDVVFLVSILGAVGIGVDAGLLLLMYHVVERRAMRTVAWSSYCWKIAIYVLLLVGAGAQIYTLIYVIS